MPRARKAGKETKPTGPPEVQGDAGEMATDAPEFPAVEEAEPTSAPETKKRKPYYSV